MQNQNVLAVVAHPDDAEFICAGTLTLLHQKGWHVSIATMTAGDGGSKELGAEEISAIRREEARKATDILNGDYYCLESKDMFILYDQATLLRVIELIRKTKPTIVLTMSPQCYLIDHENTSKLAQTACFAAGIPNIQTPGYEALSYIPALYYGDAIEGKDKLGNPVLPNMVVDITSVMDTKTKMLACHASQREWLLAHHGMDEYLHAMEHFSAQKGELIGRKYGEGFRQHLGHAYPQENVLGEALGEVVLNL